VEKSERLSIAFDRHAPDETFGRCFEDFNPHLLIECSTSALTKNV
jgi:hypothetical protein